MAAIPRDGVNLGDTRITDPTSVTLITDGQHGTGAANVVFSLADVATTRHASNFITAALDGHVSVFKSTDTTWNNGGEMAIPVSVPFINALTGTGDCTGINGSLSYSLDSEVTWTCPGATVTPADANMKATITFPAVGMYTVTANSNPPVPRTVYVTTLNVVAPTTVDAGMPYSYVLNDGITPAGGTFLWEYQKQGDSGWTAVTGGTTNPASISLPGIAGVTSTYSVRCTSNLMAGLPPIQSSPITVGAVPPPTVSMVSFGLPTGPNWTSGSAPVLNAYQSPNAAETVVGWNTFLGSGTPTYYTAPTFVPTTQIVATGIAASVTGTYSTTLTSNYKYFSYGSNFLVYTNGSTSNPNMLGGGADSGGNNTYNIYVRTVAAAESRYAYIYYPVSGGTHYTAVTLVSKIIDAAGATVATETKDLTSTFNTNGSKVYMGKIQFYGGVPGKNLDVQLTVSRSDTWATTGCGGVIITK